MELFEYVSYRQPEVIEQLVENNLLPRSVLVNKQLPKKRRKNGGFSFIKKLMTHDYYKRIGGALKQRGWGSE